MYTQDEKRDRVTTLKTFLQNYLLVQQYPWLGESERKFISKVGKNTKEDKIKKTDKLFLNSKKLKNWISRTMGNTMLPPMQRKVITSEASVWLNYLPKKIKKIIKSFI